MRQAGVGKRACGEKVAGRGCNPMELTFTYTDLEQLVESPYCRGVNEFSGIYQCSTWAGGLEFPRVASGIYDWV